MPDSHSRPLLDKAQIAGCLERLADEICQKSAGAAQLALVGIHKRGVPMAQRLAALVQARGQVAVVTGTIDVTQYRDDLQTMAMVPKLEGSEITFDIDDAHVILCDEVLFTGRTVRAALNELLDFGRPKSVRLAVLVDRGGRELPIQPDFVGLTLDVQEPDRVCVRFEEVDGLDTVFVQPSGSKES